MSRLRRSLDGLSVGDAFGERFFGRSSDVAWRIRGRVLPPAPWRHTDDTAMALSICSELRDIGEIDCDRLARAFALRYAADPTRGYGRTAHDIISSILEGVPWRRAASEPYGGAGSMGNGGAMRSAPLGAYFTGDYDRAALEARRSAKVTHAHPEGQAGAIAVAVAAACAASKPVSDGHELLEIAERHTPEGATRDRIRRAQKLPFDAGVETAVEQLGNGSEFISEDTVGFSLWCAARNLASYPEALWFTVSGLGDRDTTCAIVGGIVALSAPDSLPRDWLEAREPLAW